MNRRGWSLLIGLGASGLLLCGSPALGDDEGAALYEAKICHTCHGEDGTHPVTADYPVIAGQPVKYLVRQMKDIRDGRRTNGLSETMRTAVQGVTDDEFEKIAAWLASRW
jgi:cytochrome c553